MHKRFLFIVSVFAIVVLAGFVFFGTKLMELQDQVQTEPSIHQVNVLPDGKVDPVAVLINKGDYVQFNSRDGKEHTMVQGKTEGTALAATYGSSSRESGMFRTDEPYRAQFTEVGAYEFHDQSNSKITVSVVVYDSD